MAQITQSEAEEAAKVYNTDECNQITRVVNVIFDYNK
jgi:hypothetical protein